MNISQFLQYKVCEIGTPGQPGGGIVILDRDDKLKYPVVHELIIADMPTCCEYLARYTDARARGKTWRDSHTEALRGADVVPNGGRVVQ